MSTTITLKDGSKVDIRLDRIPYFDQRSRDHRLTADGRQPATDDLGDGLHPTTVGHYKYAEYAKTILSIV